MKTLFSLFAILTFSFSIVAQIDATPFRFYDDKGKEVEFEKLIKKLGKADVVLFGELHNNAMVHWLQLRTVQALHVNGEELVLGAEMFETDDQLLIDEYLSGTIREKNFEDEAKLWNNYETDYKPLLTFAKDSGLHFIATNIPRRYAAMVSKTGIEGLNELSEDAKKLLPTLPIEVSMETPGYQEMLEMMGGGHGMHGNPMNFVAAQASKDATMAHFIYQNWDKKKLFVHFNGDFHSKGKGGIYYYLNQLDDKLDVAVIAVVEGDPTIYQEEWSSLANFVLVIPKDMAKSY